MPLADQMLVDVAVDTSFTPGMLSIVGPRLAPVESVTTNLMRVPAVIQICWVSRPPLSKTTGLAFATPPVESVYVVTGVRLPAT